MYLLLPFATFIISLSALAYIVSRKFVYLKKLSPDVLNEADSQEGFWEAMFPELFRYFSQKNIQTLRLSGLGMWSKLLIKFRAIWKSVDAWIHKHITFVRLKETYHRSVLFESQEKEAELKVLTIPKEQEQDLIIQIAKDPKNVSLYKELGALYVTMKEWDDALESYSRALELDASDSFVMYEINRIRRKIEV